ncbi:hypothetical protein Vi05172_g9399 [Venturia inaequalis]|nr:hypothetical protein Vi05172_g9399 [Venturia inaequalis]
MSTTARQPRLIGPVEIAIKNEEETTNSARRRAENAGAAEGEGDDLEDEVEYSEYDSAIDSTVAYDLDYFKDDLREYLDNIQTAGSAWSEQTLISFPNPGLTIRHLGLIPLPLSDYHAKTIVEFLSRPSPLLPEPLIDGESRQVWELPRSAFELINSAWNAQLEQILAKVVKDLGIKTKVDVDLRKLSLYETGAVFNDPHRGNFRRPGMFGSLVVFLPSQHEGCRLHLSHGDSTQSFDLASSGIQLDLKAVAWFSDVSAQMDVITSGYRLAISYDMVQSPTMLEIPSAGDLIKEEKHLQYLMRQWRKQLPNQDKFLHLLEHKYERSNFSLAALKGQDALVAQRLLKGFSVQGFHLFFGRLYHTLYFNDELDSTNSLWHIINPEGLELGISCPVDVGADALDEHRFLTKMDGDQDDSGSLPITKRNFSVAILVSSERLPNFLMRLNPTKNLAGFVVEKAIENRDDPSWRAASIRVVKKCRMPSSNVARLSLLLHDLDLFHHAIKMSPSRKAIGSPDEVLDELIKFLNDNAQQRLSSWRQWIRLIVTNIKSISNLPPLLEKLDLGLVTAHHKLELTAWRPSMVSECLGLLAGKLHRQHCSFVFYMIKAMPPQWTGEWLLPVVSNLATDNCLRTLLDTLFSERHIPQFQAIIEPYYRHILGKKGHAFVLKPVNLRPCTPRGSSNARDPMFNHHIDKFFTMMENALSLGVGNQVAVIVNASMDRICHGQDKPGDVPLSTLHHDFLADIAKRFLNFVTKHPIILREIVALPFFTALLEAPVDALLKRRPNELNSWTRKAKGCGRPNCPACPPLIDFLKSPSQRVKSIILPRDHREHVCKYFASSNLELRKEDIGSSCTLLVVKTTSGVDKQMTVWKKEVQDLERAWTPLRCDYLKNLLGNKYDELVMLSRLQARPTTLHIIGAHQSPNSSEGGQAVAGPSTTQRRSLDTRTAESLSARQIPRVAGVKRAAEVELLGGPSFKK